MSKEKYVPPDYIRLIQQYNNEISKNNKFFRQYNKSMI